MNVKDLINELKKYPKDKRVILGISECTISVVTTNISTFTDYDKDSQGDTTSTENVVLII